MYLPLVGLSICLAWGGFDEEYVLLGMEFD